MSETQPIETVEFDVRPDRVATLLSYGQLVGAVERPAANRWEVVDRPLDGGPEFLTPNTAVVGGSPGDSRSVLETVDPDTSVVVVATPLSLAGGEPLAVLEALQQREPLGLAVVSLPAHDEPAGSDPAGVVDRVRSVADGTVVVPGEARSVGLTDVMRALGTIMTDPGVINLDLADVRAVLSRGAIASVTTGSGGPADETAPAVEAVSEAITAVPGGIADARGAVLQLVLGAQTSVAEAVSAVDRLRSQLGEEDPIIWGVTVDPFRTTVRADMVTGFDHRPWLEDALARADRLDAGSPCPRCGGHVATYRLGDRERLACDACGLSGVSVRRH